MKQKILFLASSSLDASSRFRVEAYKINLSEEYDIKILYLTDSIKLAPKFARSIYKKIFLLSIALTSFKYDIVFMHRSISGYKNNYFFEFLLAKINKNIIFDFDDAVFLHNKVKVSKIISLSKSIICGNDYLKEYASTYNSNAYVIPTSIDTNIFYQKCFLNSSNITIGWTGTSSNYQFFSNKLITQLSQILAKYNQTKFLFICDTMPDNRFNFKYDFIKWQDSSEVEDLQKIDIGIMPLIDNEWTRGKCGFKLIQYGAIGIPSIGSNVGVNSQIIKDKISGYLINNDDFWYENLEKLILSATLRQSFGNEARQIIKEHYSIEKNYKYFKKVIMKTLS